MLTVSPFGTFFSFLLFHNRAETQDSRKTKPSTTAPNFFFFFENKKPKDPHANKKELEHFQPLKCIPVVELTIPKGMARDTCNQDRMHDALRVDLAKLT